MRVIGYWGEDFAAIGRRFGALNGYPVIGDRFDFILLGSADTPKLVEDRELGQMASAWCSRARWARSSRNETQHWIGRATAYGYLAADCHANLLVRCKAIGRKLGIMIQNPDVILNSAV